MKGDFTRDTFQPNRQYTRVLMEQGRVQLDADWNEQQAIHQQQREARTTDTVGQCGAPETNPGFRVTTSGGALRLEAGHFYVDGILCVNVPPGTATNVSLSSQPFAGTPPDLTNVNSGLLYLDVWERHITWRDDGRIRERALGGPGTASRSQTIWQVKVLPLTAGPSAAQIEAFRAALRTGDTPALPAWQSLVAPRDNLLNARTNPAAATTEECQLPPSAGYQGLENQLYRVEIHSTDNAGAPDTFKWSRDNGMIAVDIESVSGTEIIVSTTGRDMLTSFQSGDWVELSRDLNVLDETPGELLQVERVDSYERKITLRTNASFSLTAAQAEAQNAQLRRWDQSGPTATSNGVDLSNNWLHLENGVQVRFLPGTYRTGDYWLIPARTATGEIEWPPFDIPNTSPEEQPPLGIVHHYCPLALVTRSGGSWSVDDLRLVFPQLTNIKAEDVYFDDSNCTPRLPPAETVQEAIDALCQRDQGRCQVTVTPGAGWQGVLTALGNVDAEICFQNGVYPVTSRVDLSNKGNLKLTGAGPGTRIVARNDKVALQFTNCKSVTVRDLHIEARKAGSPGTGHAGMGALGGVLTFRRCPSVAVENVSVKCTSAAERVATCITVADVSPTRRGDVGAGSVRISECDLRVGHQQIGILLLNVTRARVSDNMIRAGKRPKKLNLGRLLENMQYRAAVRELMIHGVELGLGGISADRTRVLLTANSHAVRFRTHPSLGNSWSRLIRVIRPRGVQNARDLYWHLRKVADRLLLNEGHYSGVDRRRTRGFAMWYDLLRRSMRTVADQGIVVGGTVGQDIRITQNTIWGTHIGINAGLSHKGSPFEAPDMLGTVQIADNEIGVVLSPAARIRYGIFVGNCQRLLVENNEVEVTRLPVTTFVRVDGIRVYGRLGPKAVVRHNSLTNTTVGIRVRPINSLVRKLWLVADNVMPGATLTVHSSVDEQNNIR